MGNCLSRNEGMERKLIMSSFGLGAEVLTRCLACRTCRYIRDIGGPYSGAKLE